MELKLQHIRHLMQKANLLEKILMLREIEGKRKKRTAKDESITDFVNMNLSKLREIVEERGAWHAAVHRVKE